MTVQAFAVVIRAVELDGVFWFTEVLHPYVMQAPQLGFRKTGVQSVVGVAGVPGLIAGHAAVLVMSSRNVPGVVYHQALPVVAHDVTGEAERSLLGPLDVVLRSQYTAKYGKDEQGEKGQYLTCLARSDFGPGHDHGN